MPELSLPIVAIIAGFAGLVWSADRFVAGAASIAKLAGLSPLIIGLTIVSLGTSAPEILVSINASLKDSGDLAVGNALGSNLANIGLVLGATALVATLPIQGHLLKHELPILIGVTLVAGLFLWDSSLVFYEGLLLLLLIIPVMGYLIYVKKHSFSPIEVEEEEEFEELPKNKAVMFFIIGLVLLIVSSDVLVYGATEVATHFGVSPLIIGLTVIAVGTSLPELAASIMSAIKGHHDIALGNVIGSNIFNLLAVMSIPGLIGGVSMSGEVFARDYLAMAGITLFISAFIYISYLRPQPAEKKKSIGIGKFTGVSLLLIYLAYYVLLFNDPGQFSTG